MTRNYNKSARAICSGIWSWYCVVCRKKYTKSGAHSKCYRRYCGLCLITFETEEALVKHAKELHPNDFCEKCNLCTNYLTQHKKECNKN